VKHIRYDNLTGAVTAVAFGQGWQRQPSVDAQGTSCGVRLTGPVLPSNKVNQHADTLRSRLMQWRSDGRQRDRKMLSNLNIVVANDGEVSANFYACFAKAKHQAGCRQVVARKYCRWQSCPSQYHLCRTLPRGQIKTCRNDFGGIYLHSVLAHAVEKAFHSFSSCAHGDARGDYRNILLSGGRQVLGRQAPPEQVVDRDGGIIIPFKQAQNVGDTSFSQTGRKLIP
jgi:hypothetical protein